MGSIIDVEITPDGKINSFIIEQGNKFLSFNRENEEKVLWNNITKIGEDVILIKKE